MVSCQVKGDVVAYGGLQVGLGQEETGVEEDIGVGKEKFYGGRDRKQIEKLEMFKW